MEKTTEREDRHPHTIRLRDQDEKRLQALKRALGASKVAVVRQALRELAKREGLE